MVSAAEIAQTGSYSWLVIDQAMVDASSVIQGYIKNGYTVTGQTYAELAEAMGVDPDAFTATMEKWNACVAAGVDEEFGRTSFANPLDTAPYYAIKVTAGIHHTMGGLTTLDRVFHHRRPVCGRRGDRRRPRRQPPGRQRGG